MPPWQASAGTGCNKECIEKFDELQKKRKYKYIIYKIDGQEVVVDCTGEPSVSRRAGRGGGGPRPRGQRAGGADRGEPRHRMMIF